jgi:hypothetical protein
LLPYVYSLSTPFIWTIIVLYLSTP